MFDVGFQELLLVFVIGLLILGPERLPKVAAQVGRWVGRARRMANQLRYQLEREIAMEEFNRTHKRTEDSAGSDAQEEGAGTEDPQVSGPDGAASDTAGAQSASGEAGGGIPPTPQQVAARAGAEETSALQPSAAEAPEARPLGNSVAGTSPPGRVDGGEAGGDGTGRSGVQGDGDGVERGERRVASAAAGSSSFRSDPADPADHPEAEVATADRADDHKID